MSASRKRDLFALAIGLAVLLVDQLTKVWVVQYFGFEGGRAEIPILGPFLGLFYVQNSGVAFSLLQGQNIKFALIFLALGLIGYLYWRFRASPSLWLRMGFALVLGGALGNLLDRFTRGYVVDFVAFQIPSAKFYFPLFNVADSAITIGVALIAAVFYYMSSTPANEQKSLSSAGDQPTSSDTPASAHSGERS
ncbi:MAG TPA: signal peptidase II [Ktedonobacterales bacterium]